MWHCSLAIKAGQGILTDQEWEAVIRDYLTRMNIIDGDDDQGVTWLAVRHGLSANGNDHVHIMVQLAADDGWINPYHDRINAQKSCRRMEKTRPELVELARSDTGTRVSWQYGQWRQWAEWKARNEYGDDEGWDALDGNERSRLVTAVAGLNDAAPACRPDRGGVRQGIAQRGRVHTPRAQGRLLHRPQAAQGNRQRLVHRPRPGGRLQDHVAQHGRVDGTVQRLRARRRHAIETTARRLGGRCQKPRPGRAGMARRDGEPPPFLDDGRERHLENLSTHDMERLVSEAFCIAASLNNAADDDEYRAAMREGLHTFDMLRERYGIAPEYGLWSMVASDEENRPRR